MNQGETLKKMKNLVAYIKDNLHEKLTPQILAERSGLNSKHIARLFLRHYGVPTATYIRDLRLETAAKYLKETELSVTEVMRLTGFGGNCQFHNQFREKFNTTPLEYSGNQKERIRIQEENLDRANDMLRNNSGVTIKAIAGICGFKLTTFHTQFIRRFGMTPAEARSESRNTKVTKRPALRVVPPPVIDPPVLPEEIPNFMAELNVPKLLSRFAQGEISAPDDDILELHGKALDRADQFRELLGASPGRLPSETLAIVLEAAGWDLTVTRSSGKVRTSPAGRPGAAPPGCWYPHVYRAVQRQRNSLQQPA